MSKNRVTFFWNTRYHRDNYLTEDHNNQFGYAPNWEG